MSATLISPLATVTPPPAVRRRRLRTLALMLVAALVGGAIGAGVTAVATPQPAPPGEWRQVFSEDFDRSVPVGQFPGTVYKSRFTVYPDGWADTLGQGSYAPSQVLSVADGSLVFDMHTGADGRPLGAAALPTMPTYGQIYGKYEIRFRADPVAGYGLAFLLWPDSEKWPRDGEVDYPEGDLDGRVLANAHHADPAGSVEKSTTASGFDTWHVATTIWRKGELVFLLDGVQIARSVTGVPSRSMHWVLQAGTVVGQLPSPSARARIQVDWMRAYAHQ